MGDSALLSRLILVSLFALLWATPISEDVESCSAHEIVSEHGHVLLQAARTERQVSLKVNSLRSEEFEDEDDGAKLALIRALAESAGIGATAPLTEEGYKEVFAVCCNLDMATFTKRVIDSVGLEVCDIGGLGGMVPWYTCQTIPTNKPKTLAALKSNLLESQPPTKCAFLAPSGQCQPKDQDCKGEIGHDDYGSCGNSTEPIQVPATSSTITTTTTTTITTTTTTTTSTTSTTTTTTTITTTTTTTTSTTTSTTTTTTTITTITTTTTTLLQCINQEGTKKSLGSHQNSNVAAAEVFEWTDGTYFITETQGHAKNVCCENAVGTLYKCKVRAHGGWGVAKANCCNCGGADPLSATRSRMYKASAGSSCYTAYYDCEEVACPPPPPP
mmetsp:Transcript_37989/g.68201  ORF Transcript_37989/g.68201 Transcript_37989/m.68201 type:complete len:387 (-) Transcript_37989:44-1204(-)